MYWETQHGMIAPSPMTRSVAVEKEALAKPIHSGLTRRIVAA